MKAIVCAAGMGTRLFPVTIATSKHLLPVYDKPMIYYPISVLMLAGIRDILLIVNDHDKISYENLLGDGSLFGVKFTYIVQPTPGGLPQALILGEKFLNNEKCCLILGDNVFYGQGFVEQVKTAITKNKGATIFVYKVFDPRDFGVAKLDNKLRVLELDEKPEHPKTNLAVTGLYVFDGSAPIKARELVPSSRGEIEIIDLLRSYLANDTIHAQILGRGMAWLDMGSHETMLEASHFVSSIQNRQGLKIACLEEIALLKGWITLSEIRSSPAFHAKNDYSAYLHSLIETC
ncbi:glucose-1-phosphate thymidylyltransferase RfbA [Alphaproteobacteria bacterium]|nr:glucose-1-phosphate thymidylyltransferase RfbA [Alphaproteobacteria bacterium]